MNDPIAHLRLLVQMGHFNYPCSTEVDTEMAERALDSIVPGAVYLDSR